MLAPPPAEPTPMNTTVSILALALVPALAAARTDVDDPPAAAAEVEAPAFACEEGVALPLSGLTEANAADVRRALEGLKRPRYRCPACKTKADWQATCEGCGELFEALDRGVPLLESVRLDVATQTACVDLDQASVLRLTALGAALAPTKVGLRRADIEVGAWTRVTVRIPPGDVAKARKALQRPGLFASVGVRVDEGSPSTSFIVQHPPRRPVSLARFARALSEAVPGGVTFEDVSWTAACLTCSERGRRRGSCRACWQAEFRRERNQARLRGE